MTLSTFALLGSHASTAMSPRLWTRAFELAGEDLAYTAFDARTAADLGEAERRLRGGEFVALNVTMPHKPWASDIADDLDEDVVASGAANLLVPDAGRVRALNTDIMAVRNGIGGEVFDDVLLLGAGGAGSGALTALSAQAHHLTIADADLRSAERLLMRWVDQGGVGRAVGWRDRAGALANHDLIVNATPIGRDSPAEIPWGDGSPADSVRLYDFVYASGPTAVETWAVAHDAPLLNGWSHLLRQAEAMIKPLGLAEALHRALRKAMVELGGNPIEWR